MGLEGTVQDHAHKKQDPPVLWGQGELTFSGPCLRRADSYQSEEKFASMGWGAGGPEWKQRESRVEFSSQGEVTDGSR